jgi:insertion element IS1 protein InsB
MKQCPYCQRIDNQVKNGKTSAGSQIYKCKVCNRKYTPEPKTNGYTKDRRQQAIRLVLDGNSQRQAARHAGVSHGTVANWFKQYADELPDELPGTGIAVDVAEQDELFTFIGHKKTKSTS